MAVATPTTLSGTATADNAIFVYLSTSPSSLGTLLASGNNWGSPVSFTGATLTPGVTNYLEIEMVNYGGPYGLLGSFSLSGTSFSFANGTQALDTNATNWLSTYNDTNSVATAQPWVQATGAANNQGINGVGPWGYISGIDSAAEWLGNPAVPSSFNNGNFTIDFETAITATSSAIPEPGTLTLLTLWLTGTALVRRRAKPVSAPAKRVSHG